jgi:hypothetical protein
VICDMVRVCAWCRVFLGLKRPLDRWVVTHGMCPKCQTRWSSDSSFDSDPPARLLVVSRDPIGLEAAGQLIAQAGQPMILLADRRRAYRDRRHRTVPVSLDRRRTDRRALPPATWADGYVYLEPALTAEMVSIVLG